MAATTKTTSAPIGSNQSSLSTKQIQSAVGATADGSYGPQTTASVKAFQTANGLVADGIVGPKTSAAILAASTKPTTGGSSSPSTNMSTPTTGGGSSTNGTSVSGGMSKPTGFTTAPKTTSTQNNTNPFSTISNIWSNYWSGGSDTTSGGMSKPTQTPVETTAVSSKYVTNKVVPQIQKTFTDADKAKQDAEVKKQQEIDNSPITQQFLTNGDPNPKYVPPVITPPVPEVPKTPEQLQADEINHSGEKELFNDTTGIKEWVKDGTPGYSNIDPKQKAQSFVAEADAGSGITIRQLSDGTYIRYNTTTNTPAGGATQQQFNDAKAAGQVKQGINNLINGIYDSNQQSQLNAISADYDKQIATQNDLNDTLTKGINNQTAMSGIYDMRQASSLTSKLNAGVDYVSGLLTDKSGALAKMKQAFYENDTKLLQSTYGVYQDTQDRIQTGIDKMQTLLANEQQKQADKLATTNRTNSIKYHVDIPDDATPQQARDIMNTSPIYKYELETKAGQADPDVTDAQVKYYKTNGTLPTFSYGTLGHAERNAFWSAIGGNPSTIIDATTNKAALHAATAAQAKIQTIKSGTESSIVTLKNGITIAEDEMGKMFKTGSPFLNKPLQYIQNQLSGNAQYSALNQAISTVATEYAKIKNGASASIAGAPVTSVEEEKKLLNIAMSNGQLESTFEVIKKDSNARLVGFNAGLDSIRKDIEDLQNTNLSDTSSNSSTTGSNNDPAGLGL